MGNQEAEKGIAFSGIAVTKLSEPLDEFKCHPNNMNHLRQQYINIMAELADSNVLSDVLGQLLGTSITYKKLSNDLGNKLRMSNYALS